MAFETGGTPFFKFVAVLVFVLCLAGCEESSKPDENWQQVSMEENLAVLKTDPGNCFALGQVAAAYQVQYQIKPAIVYFEKLMERCPDQYSSRFQLGICYLFDHDRERAVSMMDRAIADARRLDDARWVAIYEKEKELWLKKWPKLKQLNLQDLPPRPQ